MTERDVDQNPFSTARVRPGALPFTLPTHETLDGLWERFLATGERGQIIGPHGTGKSTLLRAFAQLAERRGRATVMFGAAPGQQLPRWGTPLVFPGHAVVLVDSYEQLGTCERLRLRRACRRQTAGLLVTCHSDASLPTLWRTEPTLELFEQLVECLMAGFPPLITTADVHASYHRHGGNLRESLFRLYDLYESRRRVDGPESQT
ncbi:MAG: hypothetical protein ACKO38_21605 [Planctomycetota bacterium]